MQPLDRQRVPGAGGANTRPSSNSETSGLPCAALCATARSTPGSSAGRSTDSSAQRILDLDQRSVASPARARSAGATSGSVYTSSKPAPTSTSATARRSRCTAVSAADLRRTRRNRARDAVEPDAARDFLDEIDLALDVGPPRGNDRGPAVHLDPERREQRCTSSSESSVARSTGSPARCGPSRARARSASGTRRSLPARAAPTRPSRTAPSRAPRRRRRRWDRRPLEARARLGAQAEPLRRLGDARRLEVRRLEQDLGGGRDTSAAAPPMIPAMPCATRSASQISRSSG